MSQKTLTISENINIGNIKNIEINVNNEAEMKSAVTQKRRQNLLDILNQLKEISAEMQNKLTIAEFNAEKDRVKDSLEKIKKEFKELSTKEASKTGKIIESSINTLKEKIDSSNLDIDEKFKKIDERLSSRIQTLSIRIDETNQRIKDNTNNIYHNGKGIESNKAFITNNANKIEDIKSISLTEINKNVKNTQTSLNTALQNYKNIEKRLQSIESSVSKNTQTTTWVLNVVNPALKVWNNTLEYVSDALKEMRLKPLEQETLSSTASVNRSTISTDTDLVANASSNFPQSEQISYSASNTQQEKSFSYTMGVNKVLVSAVSN